MPESARRIPIAFGTDVVFVMPGETRGTLSIEFISGFLEAGATPKQILQALTVDSAKLMGMEGAWEDRPRIRGRHRRHTREPALEHPDRARTWRS